MFYVGHLRPFRWSEVKHVSSHDDMRDAAYGDIFEVLGHIFEWDDDCVPSDLCTRWQHEGDPVCDAALRQVFANPSATVGKDLLRSLQDFAADHPDDPCTSPVNVFLSEVKQNPPPGLLVSEEDVEIARELFLDDSIQIVQALLHYSLAGGLASPRIVRTLEATSYLLPNTTKLNSSPFLNLDDLAAQIPPASADRTFVRLVETMQFVLDVMACTLSSSGGPSQTNTGRLDPVAHLLPGGEGWKSSLRVRLLHAVARWRVELRWEKDGHATVLDSVPISQQELAATLSGFSTVPMWSLRRLHIPPTPRQANAYLALWRHVGFYMGVSPAILRRYFSNTHAADKFNVTVSLNLFFEELPSPASTFTTDSSHHPATPTALRGPTVPILVAVSQRGPMRASLAYNAALTVHLLGPALAARVGLPPAGALPLAARAKMRAALLAQCVPHVFARWYPRTAWRAKRRAVLAEGLARSVWWYIGARKSAFRPRTGVREGAEGDGGELADGVKEAEGTRLDPARARVLTRMWKEVFVEMVGVCAVVCTVGAALGKTQSGRKSMLSWPPVPLL